MKDEKWCMCAQMPRWIYIHLIRSKNGMSLLKGLVKIKLESEGMKYD